MGAWSADSFGNDTACDWSYSLEESSDLSLIYETLQKVINSGKEYLQASDAEEAIAAAEVIARLKGNFGIRNAYTETVDKWVEANPQQPSQELLSSANQVLDRILTPPSELLELWEENDDLETWKNEIQDLKIRLSK